MENYKDKYDNIVSQLFELVQKRRELEKAEKELEVNLEKTKACSDELSKLDGELYDMKHGVICDKTNKCMGRLFLFTFSSSLLLFLFDFVGWAILLYLALNIIAYRNIYVKKVNDKNYMFGELERNLEYRETVEQMSLKKEIRNDLLLEEEKLNEVITDLYLETQYLYMMICEFVDEEEIQKEIDEVLENSEELEVKDVIDKSLVRRKK